MPFGRYKGLEVYELPTDYLDWLWSNVTLWGNLEYDVERELRDRGRGRRKRGRDRENCGRRRATADSLTVSVKPADTDLLCELIDAGYRALAKKHHPDTGGEAEAMRRLNRLAEELRNQI
jgi:hypothetical protein